MLFYSVWVEVNCRFILIIWALAYLRLGCAWNFESVKCCCRTRLTRNNLVLATEESGTVHNWLVSCILPGGRIPGKVSSRIQKARLALANFRHLWRRCDIRSATKVQVNTATMRSIGPLNVEDVRGISVVEHCCLRGLDRILWEKFVSKSEVRRNVLEPRVQSSKEVVGTFFREPTERLSRCTGLQGKQWLKDRSRWIFGDMEKICEDSNQWSSYTVGLQSTRPLPHHVTGEENVMWLSFVVSGVLASNFFCFM